MKQPPDAHAHLERGKGRKVTIPTFSLKSPIRSETVYQLDHPVGYYHPLEKKGKRKRASPQRIQEEHVLYQQREPSPQKSPEVGGTQIHVDVQLPPTLPSQLEEGDILETSIPPQLEERISLVTPQKQKRIKVRMSKGKKVRKRLVPNPFFPRTIPKEETDRVETESEEEEEVPLKRRTRQDKATQMEVRKNATRITPSF